MKHMPAETSALGYETDVRPSLELSVVIITYNEQECLPRTLEALNGVADEIIIVDSGSTDATQQIACAHPLVRWFQRSFDTYGQQKNFGNKQARGRYIFSLDADEVLSPQLRDIILREKGKWSADAYALLRIPIYIGTEIRCSDWYPDIQWRLFRRDVARWSNDLVHEHLIIESDARRKRLDGELLHYSYLSTSDHMSRNIRYSMLGAQMRFARGRRPLFVHALLRAFLRFLKSFVFKRGYRAGWRGWAIALLGASVYLQREIFLAELWEHSTSAPNRA
ncbi:MAG: glycosyltransferase family 2 protein [Chlorobi bacterium]|nr:glycosyltransferase family 2 protein [Chlorobiota bacterium]